MSGSGSFDLNHPDLVSVLDELPLWSAPFGLKLLSAVRLRRGIAALDIGCGTGFPLLELAGRLGESCHVTGLDPWEAAIARIRMKIRTTGIGNVTVVPGIAEQMPFADASFDLIASNNGINNVSDPEATMRECARVGRPGAQLVITVNLPDTMKEFYGVYAGVLHTFRMESALIALQEHIHMKRKPAEWTTRLVERAGFRIQRSEEDSFSMKYTDGTTMLNHFFIRLAFLEPWRSVVSAEDVDRVFRALEEELNRIAESAGELRLTIPFLCLSAFRT